MKVVVVGSGLSAVGALKAITKAGIKPLVIDVGRQLDPERQKIKLRMSMNQPMNWSDDDVKSLASNFTANSNSAIPKKLVLGSDYFYSSDNSESVKSGTFSRSSPSYSLALGGFSAGWGAAFLPPAESDIKDWPISREEILEHMRECVQNISCSEPVDELSKYFPALKQDSGESLRLTKGQHKLLQTLSSSTRSTIDSPEVFGQARVMTRSKNVDNLKGCNYCGYCNAGCVYDAIYKAELDISRMQLDQQIEYLGGWNVVTINEQGSSVKISMISEVSGEQKIIEADRLFLAAGAVNSTRIMLQSQNMSGFEATIKQTGGFLQPFVSAVHYPVDWPNQNTQSNLFLEFKEPQLSEHWVHVQVSQPNEVAMSKLGLNHKTVNSVRGKLAKFISGNLLIAMVNTHSAHGSQYVMRLGNEFKSGIAQIESKRIQHPNQKLIIALLNSRLKKIFRRRAMTALGFMRQDWFSSLGYHFGSSFPMSANPKLPTDTDNLGRPFGWKHVHIVDTSVLPSIPGTSIGLLAMANAHRIASEALDN
ncbi:MAG: GMC oxidoreductase [Actinomycetota bacterium]